MNVSQKLRGCRFAPFRCAPFRRRGASFVLRPFPVRPFVAAHGAPFFSLPPTDLCFTEISIYSFTTLIDNENIIYIYMYRSIYLSIYLSLSLSVYIYIYIYVYTHILTTSLARGVLKWRMLFKQLIVFVSIKLVK